ncbi:MAG: stage II sporulation protein D [Ruminococcus sp.]
MLDITSGRVEEISVRDYVIGAVCAEMPATFEPDALKAQAVAAHTYAERQHLLESASPTASLCGTDFSNDSSQYQAYFTENQARQYYGDNFETAYAKVTQAVDDVPPYVLEYDGAPIIAAFCSMSAGVTESAENIWGSKVEYLVPVESQADTSAPRYLETAQFTGDEFQAAVQSLLPGAVWEEDMAKWVQIGVSSPSGTVLEVTVGGVSCTGQQLREALGLRSAVFSVEVLDGRLVFTTKGYGHGVGMSQFGANAMAKDGAGWQEILAHYYPAAELTEGQVES